MMISSLEARAESIRNWPPEALKASKTKLEKENYGILYSVYADLAISHAWEDMKIHYLDDPCRPLLSGIDRSKGTNRRLVYPISASGSTSIKELDTLFQATQHSLGNEQKKVLLGIVHTDSTVVYYTLNEGIVKPTVN